MNKRSRIMKVIDGDRSYIQTYHRDDTQEFILFIHGILGHHRETWKDTPAQLMTEHALAEADFGSFGYDTGTFDTKETRTHALQLITWMQVHLATYRRIYIIAHSMGGLITREACGLLARNGTDENKSLLSRIKHGFFVAVPIAGSSVAAWLASLPLINRINSKVAFLANPRIAGEQLKNFYEESIRLLGDETPRPKFSLVTGTADGLVAEPPEWALTRDDRYEGVVQGTHATIKTDQCANSTLLRLIVEKIESYQRDPLLQTASFRAINAEAQTRDVLVLACSATKRGGNEMMHSNRGGVPRCVLSEKIRDTLFKQRAFTKDLIESGRIQGQEFQEGNRKSKQQNRSLLLGADFGGLENEVRYLPAYKRYMGRAFQLEPQQWENFFAVERNARPHILIVSGLYGLCEAEELIQNYDCHLSDIDSNTGLRLHNYWRQLLTELLISHLAGLEKTGCKIGRVLNLLVEDVYRDVIEWDEVNIHWRVLHQRFEKFAGRQALDHVGVWLQKVVTQPSILRTLQPGIFYDDVGFSGGDRVTFDLHINHARPTARESSVPISPS